MYSIETALPIRNFPQTPADLPDLDAASIGATLRALGADTTGGLEAKRQRLRIYIGLRPIPVLVWDWKWDWRILMAGQTKWVWTWSVVVKQRDTSL
jgi:hypothetical protein